MRPNLANKNPRLPGASLQRPTRKAQTSTENYRKRPSIRGINEFGQAAYLLPKNFKGEEFYKKVSSETRLMKVKRHWKKLTHFLVEDWFLSALLGVIVAVISIFVDVSYEYLNYFQVVLYDYALNYDRLLAFVCWTSYITVFVAAAALLCKYISMEAVGSGIPELKVIMNGFVLPNYLTMRTLVAKVLGLILTLGSGLPVGKEGSFVHIGSIVGVSLSKLTQHFQGNKLISSESREFQNMLSGYAVGIACCFSAPVGAVLYAIESTHKYFAVKHYWRSFFATTCAALVFRYANALIAPPHIGETILAYYETHFPNEVFVAEELPVFIFLGIVSGFLAASFVYVHKEIVNFRKNNKTYRRIFGKNYDVTFTIFMAFLVGVVNWPDGIGNHLGGRFTFREVLSDFISNCTMSERNHTRHGCPDDIVWRWRDVEEDLYANHRVLPTLFGYLFANYFLIAVCISLSLPTGTFIPSIVIGACTGRIVGETMFLYFPQGIRGIRGTQIYPGLYAIVGASAFNGAMTHSFSIAVIVCEATGQINGLLPILVALMVANGISSFLSPSIYDSIIRLKNYPHLAALPSNRDSVHSIAVEEIMVQDFDFITTTTNYKELRDLLAGARVKSFPLVNNSKEKILLGSVGRRYLNYILTTHLGPDPSLLLRRTSGHASDLYATYRRSSAANSNNIRLTDRHIIGNTLLSTSPLHEDHISRNSPLAPLLRRQTLPEISTHSIFVDRDKKMLKPIDLDAAAIDPAPFQLVLGTSIHKVHTLFSQLGLNHAFVTHQGSLMGVVGLKEIRNIMHEIKNNDVRKRNATSFVRPNCVATESKAKTEDVEEEDLIHDDSTDDENEDAKSVILPAITLSNRDDHVPEDDESYSEGDDNVFESDTVSTESQK